MFENRELGRLFRLKTKKQQGTGENLVMKIFVI
jgi:hypothetical protein